jgi:hypothetical protein
MQIHPQILNPEPRSNGGDVVQRLHELEIRRLRGVRVEVLPSPSSTWPTIGPLNQPGHGSFDSPANHSQLSLPPEPTFLNVVEFPPVSIDSELQLLSTSSPEEAHLALDTKKRKWMGSSSVQVLTQWLGLYSAVPGSGQPLSASFRFGMTHAEEVSLPLTVQLPKLPTR